MKITRRSLLSGQTRQLNLPIRQADWKRYVSGVAVQEAFPYLSADDREFILTGITNEEWGKYIEG